MTGDTTLTTTEAPELHVTHATDFKIFTSDKELVLVAGERQITLDEQGNPDASTVEVDTKIRMDHQTGLELLQGLEDTIDREKDLDSNELDPGRGVQ